MIDHWSVSVSVNHENVVTLESNCCYGKESFTEEEEETIRVVAEHLLAFIGNKRAGREADEKEKEGVPF